VEMLVVPLAIVLLGAAAYGWMREQRTWVRFFGASGRDQAEALRIHSALRAAGVRCRYKFAHAGLQRPDGGTIPQTTAIVQVHRNDVHRANEVRAKLRDERLR